MTRYRYRATAYAMKIDHIIVYREPRPSRVSVDVRTGHANSVIAAGTVPRRSPKTRTLENIQAPKNGAKYTYVDEMRALGPNALADMPEMIKLVDVTRYAQM